MITVSAGIGKKKTAVGQKRDAAIFLKDNILRKPTGTVKSRFHGILRCWVTVGWAWRSRVSTAGNIEIGTFLAAHPDGQILAGLAATDKMGVFPFDPATGDMLGAIDRPGNYFVSAGRVVIIEEPDAGGDLVAVGKIERRPWAFDDDSIGIIGIGGQGLGQGAIAVAERIGATGTEQHPPGRLQRAAATRAGGSGFFPGRIRRCACRYPDRRRRR